MSSNNNSVVVVDIKMPFLSMVIFMVKWAIAAIPAIIILAVIGTLISGLVGGFFIGWDRHGGRMTGTHVMQPISNYKIGAELMYSQGNANDVFELSC